MLTQLAFKLDSLSVRALDGICKVSSWLAFGSIHWPASPAIRGRATLTRESDNLVTCTVVTPGSNSGAAGASISDDFPLIKAIPPERPRNDPLLSNMY